MSSTVARAFLVSFGVLVLTVLGCKQTKSCAPNTVFVSFTFSGAALDADSLTMVTCLADRCRPAELVQHTSGKSTGSVELTFTTYTPDTTLKVTVTPMKGTDALTPPVSQSVVLKSECTVLPISVGSNTDAGSQTGTLGSGGNGGLSGSNSGGAGGQAGEQAGGAGGEVVAPGGQPGGTGGQPALCSESATRTCAMDGLMGDCAKGTETCIGGKWGACSISPQGADTCSVAGGDANCNGAANEGCACIGTATRSCALDGFMGNCAKGTETCAGGKWGACSVAKQASDSCSMTGDDANCDGTPNEGCACVTGATQPCGPQIAQGICKQGTQTCMANAWGACQGAVYAGVRNCASALDNDCDGRPDNTMDTVCQCASNTVQACGAHPGNDGHGPCHAGSQTCVLAADKTSANWGACIGSVGPAADDTCVASNDDNCDGVPNHACLCILGATRNCGVCNDGSQACTNGKAGAYGTCTGGSSQHVYYQDADHDGYGNASAPTTVCGGAPSAYVTSSNDCCDTDPNAYPGSTHWSTTPRAGGCPNPSGVEFDFNCDGVDSLGIPSLVVTQCSPGSFSEGWAFSIIPGCGQTGDLTDCMWDPVDPCCWDRGLFVQSCR